MLNITDLKIAVINLPDDDRADVLAMIHEAYGPQETGGVTAPVVVLSAEEEARQERERVAELNRLQEEERLRTAKIAETKKEIFASLEAYDDVARAAALKAIAMDVGVHTPEEGKGKKGKSKDSGESSKTTESDPPKS